MDFFEVIKNRRSIRRYSEAAVPEEVIRRAFEAAQLAPNSSNAQTWDFFWVRSPDKKEKLVQACLDQSAARTAKELVVFTSNPKNWKRSHQPLAKFAEEIQAPKSVQLYYNKLFPYFYRGGFLAPIKHLGAFFIGLFRPVPRGPFSSNSIHTVCTKSAALACENFVLAITAQGFDTCMMEGFDEWRVKSILGLGCSDRITMVISVGKATEKGTWGPQFRLPLSSILKEI